jgi:hypothetical protein
VTASNGSKVRKSAVVVLLLAVFGLSGAVELSLTVCRDVLYRPGPNDSIVQPAAALLGAGFRLGNVAELRVRAGYAGFTNQYVEYAGYIHERWNLHGVRLQAVPVARVGTPIAAASLLGGIGLASRGSTMRNSLWRGSSWERRRDVSSLAVDQTFLLGLGLDLSRRFGLDLEVERAGFSASYEYSRAYQWYEGSGEEIELSRNDNLSIGWLRSAPTGLGATLRLKL